MILRPGGDSCSVIPGEVWPGDCVFPDFTCERIRTWWARLVKDFISNGVDGIWNDMNEPAMTVYDLITIHLFFVILFYISACK